MRPSKRARETVVESNHVPSCYQKPSCIYMHIVIEKRRNSKTHKNPLLTAGLTTWPCGRGKGRPRRKKTGSREGRGRLGEKVGCALETPW